MGTSPLLWIGTSGWVYKHWIGIFYPRNLPASEQLRFYAEHYRTVEINFTFYRLPERSAFETWRTQTPQGFVFAVKGSRYLTHMKKLKDPEEPLARLMDRARGLEEKLGPILFQFPQSWRLNIERLTIFVEAVRQYAGQRFTLEFRHPSWLIPEVFDLLQNAGIALCLPSHPQMPLEVRLTASWTYIRMHRGEHGTGYSDGELMQWAERIRAFLRDGIETYVYFNNDPEGHALRDADRLRELLSGP
ncbi:MAG TPA: DUF72 domain-containing protein [Chloroflexota bacterium]